MAKYNKNEKELLFQLHEQFSGNQNDIGARFNSILIALIALFGFYGLSYGLSTNLIQLKDYFIDSSAVLMLGIVLEVVIVFLIVLLIYMGFQHRRDQTLNNKIRESYVSDKNFEKLFANYKGQNKSMMEFVPDFLFIKVVFLIVLKIILFVSFFIFPTIARSQICDTCSASKTSIDNTNKVVFNKTVYPTIVRNDSSPLKIDVSVNPIEIVSEINLTDKTNHEKSNYKDKFVCFYITALVISVLGFVIVICILKFYHKKYCDLNKSKIDQQLLSELIEFSKSNTISSGVKIELDAKILEILKNIQTSQTSKKT